MRISDEAMILSLMGSSAHQRRAIAWWLFNNFNWVGVTPGFDHAYPDKNALSIEILTQYMAQLEMLEMVYFALRERAADPTRSFTECYLGIHVKEFNPERQAKPPKHSASTMLQELEGMTVERFLRELGLPTLDEMKTADCGEAMDRVDGGQPEFNEHISTLIQWTRQAIENKANRGLHEAYMKSKHGFGVLTSPHYPEIHFIVSTKPLTESSCVADVFQFDNGKDTLQRIVDDTKLIGEIIRALFKLYLGRSPVHSCNACQERPAGSCEQGDAPDSA
jgi:hypothetical protein